MKRQVLWLAGASLAQCSPGVFSVHDDLLAYPQVKPNKAFFTGKTQLNILSLSVSGCGFRLFHIRQRCFISTLSFLGALSYRC